MNEETFGFQAENSFKPIEIVAPSSSLTRPTLLPNLIAQKNPCTILRPANIDIIITPCDSTIENPYEHCTLTGKVQNKRGREIRKRRRKKCNWLSSFFNERRLRSAATSKNYDEVRSLIQNDEGIDLNASDDKQRTALHISAANGGDAIVAFLLQQGANPNVKDIKGNTPLHLAACSAKVPIITLLLSHGADISAVDFNGQTPLHLALARLKILKASNDERSGHNALKIKADVKDIADLLKEYLAREGTEKEQSEIVSLSNKLQNVTTEQQIDELGDLLFDFTQMAIKEHR